ncbi:MAG: beta-lactamase family protein [Chloroflexi bacterium]|nr:beta-lactamase family protein [Chloroflexota bacterium]MCC6895421.1 beta-lactamase family protein [Anaerolineae bacterium]
MSDMTNQVDAIFAQWDRTNSPGCSLAVMQDGEMIYSRGYGMANFDYDLAIRPNSVFHIASISKQFAAFAIALLDQAGKLSVDDDIRKYIPEMPDYGDVITIRMLAHHTSGLRDQWDLLHMAGWRENDLKTNADVLYLASKQQELNFKPNDEYLYSNTGYTLLGLIVERVSGQTLREFTTEHIFKPLEMNDTHFHDDFEMIVKNRAYGYSPRPEGGYRISIPLFDTVGATSLFSTVEDLARWEQNFFHKRVGGEQVINLMLKPGILNNGEAIDYAFGIRVINYRGVPTFGHSGADAGYRSDFLCFPDQRFAVIIFCNLSTMIPSILSKKVADIYLAADLQAAEAEPEKITLSEEQLAPRAGVYRDPKTSGTRRLEMRDGQLWAVIFDDFVLPLAATSPETFEAQGYPVKIAFVDNGGKRELHEDMGSGKPTIYEWSDAPTVTPEQYLEFVGSYYSVELDTQYHVERTEQGLIFRHYKHKPQVLTPTAVDAFFGAGDLQFTRDAAGKIDGFTWFTGRVRKQRFDRVK